MAAGLAAGQARARCRGLAGSALRLPPALPAACPAARHSEQDPPLPAPRPDWKAKGGGSGPARLGVARAAGAGGTDGSGRRCAGAEPSLLAAAAPPTPCPEAEVTGPGHRCSCQPRQLRPHRRPPAKLRGGSELVLGERHIGPPPAAFAAPGASPAGGVGSASVGPRRWAGSGFLTAGTAGG